MQRSFRGVPFLEGAFSSIGKRRVRTVLSSDLEKTGKQEPGGRFWTVKNGRRAPKKKETRKRKKCTVSARTRQCQLHPHRKGKDTDQESSLLATFERRNPTGRRTEGISPKGAGNLGRFTLQKSGLTRLLQKKGSASNFRRPVAQRSLVPPCEPNRCNGRINQKYRRSCVIFQGKEQRTWEEANMNASLRTTRELKKNDCQKNRDSQASCARKRCRGGSSRTVAKSFR